MDISLSHPVAVILSMAGAYLLGSISTAVLVCRMMGLPDPRSQGSGNPGATNVLRTGNRVAALATLLGDMLKGLVPVLVAELLGANEWLIGAVAVAVVLGHMFPVFFGFQGGKGVATLMGVLFGITPLLGLVWAGTWLVVAGLTRYSSLAALVATLLTPVYTHLLLGSPGLTLAMGILVVAIFWRHRDNVRKLLDGTESRLGGRGPGTPAR